MPDVNIWKTLKAEINDGCSCRRASHLSTAIIDYPTRLKAADSKATDLLNATPRMQSRSVTTTEADANFNVIIRNRKLFVLSGDSRTAL